MPARMPWLLIGLVTLVGLVLRAIPVALTDFPVNDGGLFLAMTRAIQDAGWALPATVAWNGTDLPFAYPPLAFYGAGALNAVFGVDLFAVFRWLPLVASTLIVPAVFLLGRAVLRSDLGGVVAALAYALAPASYVWMIQGGGVTRSPGLLLAVLAVWQTVFLVREPTRRRAVIVGVLAGVTALRPSRSGAVRRHQRRPAAASSRAGRGRRWSMPPLRWGSPCWSPCRGPRSSSRATALRRSPTSPAMAPTRWMRCSRSSPVG